MRTSARLAVLIFPCLFVSSASAVERDTTLRKENKDDSVSQPRVVVRIATKALLPLVEEAVERRGGVDEEIVGVRSRGTSLTRGDVKARFKDCKEQIAFELVFTGTTVADTSGQNGPARLVHRSETQFVATKDVHFDGRRFHATPARIVRGETDLQTASIQSDLPRLRGLLVRRLAEVQSVRSEVDAEKEVFESVSRQVRSDFDNEVALEMAIANTLRRVAGLVSPMATQAARSQQWELRSTPTHVFALLCDGDQTELPPVVVAPVGHDEGDASDIVEVWMHRDELCRQLRPAATLVGVPETHLAQTATAVAAEFASLLSTTIRSCMETPERPCPSVRVTAQDGWIGFSLSLNEFQDPGPAPPNEQTRDARAHRPDDPIRDVSMLDVIYR